MVLGKAEGAALARRRGLDALFLLREADGMRAATTGRLFGGAGERSACPHPGSGASRVFGHPSDKPVTGATAICARYKDARDCIPPV